MNRNGVVAHFRLQPPAVHAGDDFLGLFQRHREIKAHNMVKSMNERMKSGFVRSGSC